MPDDRLPEQVMTHKLDGTMKRGRGAEENNLLESVKEDILGCLASRGSSCAGLGKVVLRCDGEGRAVHAKRKKGEE